MAIKLSIEHHHEGHRLTTHEFEQSLITFGRSKSCHVELVHEDVSRRHFIIKYVNNAYHICDEGSRLGTSLNGKPLLAHQLYPLDREHLIEIPSFTIKFSYDGQIAKGDATDLLDEILQGGLLPRESASLESNDGSYRFKFIDEKTSFVLGSLPQVDFVVRNAGVAKEHVSFVRDINGIRLNPLPEHEVFIDGDLISEPQILLHGATIRVGTLDFTFRSTADKEEGVLSENASEEKSEEELIVSSPREVIEVSAEESHNALEETKAHPLVSVLDKIFLVSFLLAFCGAWIVFFELI